MSNEIIRTEQEVNVLGVAGRAFNVLANNETGRILNQGIRTKWRYYVEGSDEYRIWVRLSFDDECHNGHETFAVTGEIERLEHRGWVEYSGGCIHDAIADHFPELANFIKWHLVSTDGPMHYLANTLYHAGDRDHNGLAKGEKRQMRDGKTGELSWRLEAVAPDGGTTSVSDLKLYSDGECPDAVPALQWVPWYKIGEGKARELNFARNSAVWLDATDEELCQDRATLEAALEARLPALMAEFKKAMLEIGFLWPAGKGD